MNAVLAFLCGVAVTIMVWLSLPMPEASVVYVPKIVNRVIQEEVLVEKDCPALEIVPVKQCIEPAYVLGLMKDCRAGKLDQSDPDITVRQ